MTRIHTMPSGSSANRCNTVCIIRPVFSSMPSLYGSILASLSFFNFTTLFKQGGVAFKLRWTNLSGDFKPVYWHNFCLSKNGAKEKAGEIFLNMWKTVCIKLRCVIAPVIS